MARYDLHPIGHDGSIERERERQRSIGTSRFLLDVQSACVVGWLVGRSLNEREPYLPQEGKVWALFFVCVCVCVSSLRTVVERFFKVAGRLCQK